VSGEEYLFAGVVVATIILVDGISIFPLDIIGVFGAAVGVLAIAIALWSHDKVTLQLAEIQRGEINEKIAMIYQYAMQTNTAFVATHLQQKIFSDLKSMESINIRWTDSERDKELKTRLMEAKDALIANMKVLQWPIEKEEAVLNNVIQGKSESPPVPAGSPMTFSLGVVTRGKMPTDDEMKDLSRMSATLFAGCITASAFVRLLNLSGAFPISGLTLLLYAAFLYLIAGLLGFASSFSLGMNSKRLCKSVSIVAFVGAAVSSFAVVAFVVLLSALSA